MIIMIYITKVIISVIYLSCLEGKMVFWISTRLNTP